VDNLQVVMNGVILDPSDYTATNGTSVVLASGAATNDLINIYAFKSFTTADMVSKSAGGTFSGAVTVPQLNADNIRIDGNTISSTDTNGNVNIDPAGTGDTIIASGNVGIGTSSVASGGSNTTNFNVHTPAATSVYLKLSNSSTGNSASDGLDLSQDASGNAYFINRENGFMTFWTNATERLRVDASGNVGIARSSPATTLDIDGTLTITGTASRGLTITSAASSGGQSDADAVYNAQDTEGGGTGSHIFKVGGSEKARLNGSGSLLVGTTSASMTGFDDARFRSHANGKTGIIVSEVFTDGEGIIIQGSSNTGNRNAIVFLNGGLGTVGSVVFSSSSTSYNTSSDYRLKENVADMTGAIDRVKALAPKRFNFIVDADTTVDGFLAHEAQTVVPEAVTGTHNEVDDDGNAVMQGIDQSKLVPLLVGALKESIAKIETLETKVAALEAGS
jgi:hypothetical protein